MEWAHWKNFYKVQPLWLVKRYFGDKVIVKFYRTIIIFYCPDRSLFRLAWILQPDVDIPSTFWTLCVSLWDYHNEHEDHQLRGVSSRKKLRDSQAQQYYLQGRGLQQPVNEVDSSVPRVSGELRLQVSVWKNKC